MEEHQKIVRTALVILIVLVACFGVYYLFIADRGKAPASSEPVPTEKIGRPDKESEGPGEGRASTSPWTRATKSYASRPAICPPTRCSGNG